MATERAWLLGLAIALLAVAAAGAAADVGSPEQAEADGCEQHPPIVIAGDHGPSGFAFTPTVDGAQPTHRPGSGVRQGSGTAEDPYVISGWCFSPTQRPNVDAAHARAGQAILLVETQAHVVIETNRIEGQGEPANFGRGIVLDGAENVTIRDNAIEAVDWYGVDARTSSHVDVAANTIHDAGLTGIQLVGTRDSTLAANRVEDSERGVHLRSTSRIQVSGNELSGHGTAVQLADAHATRIDANTIEEGRRGLYAEDSPRTEVRDNRFADQADVAVQLERADRTAVTGNRFLGEAQALEATRSHEFAVRDNEVAGGDGFSILYAGNATVTGNELVDLGVGIHVEGVHDSRVASNRLAQASAGAIVWESTGTEVADNRFEDGRVGVTVGRSQGTLIAHNAVVDHGNLAVSLPTTEDVRVEANELRGNGAAIVIDEGGGHAIHGNVIADHAWSGLEVADVAEPVDARDNWWGHEEGPSGGVQDACTGETATGPGDAIAATNADVCFDPWLATPNAAAGPR